MTTGKTLDEKRYGPGFRRGPVVRTRHPVAGCAVLGCRAEPYGSCELYVDEYPREHDWYAQVLQRLPLNVWVRTRFCEGHLKDVVERDLSWLDNPDLWHPAKAMPPVFQRPITINPALAEAPAQEA